MDGLLGILSFKVKQRLKTINFQSSKHEETVLAKTTKKITINLTQAASVRFRSSSSLHSMWMEELDSP